MPLKKKTPLYTRSQALPADKFSDAQDFEKTRELMYHFNMEKPDQQAPIANIITHIEEEEKMPIANILNCNLL